MFYVTLPSNSSMNYYPNNTLTSYTTKLGQPLELEGSWEVGLAEIQYPHTWYNIRKNEAWMTVRHVTQKVRVKLDIRPGYYHNIQKLIKTIWNVKKIYEGGQWMEISVDEVAAIVKMTIKHDVEMQLSPRLQQLLGFNIYHFGTGLYFGDRVADIFDGFYSLYVYCPLAKPRIVGDAMVPLLRVVPIKGDSGDVLTKTYERIHYIPLEQRRFETIEIYITDDTGKPVPFERGKVVVTLSFRRMGLKTL